MLYSSLENTIPLINNDLIELFMTTDKDVLPKLKKIVTPYTQNKAALEDFTIETDFINDLEINSANLVDVVLDVEDEFNIEIDNDSMDGMLTVGDAIAIIRGKKMAGDGQ